MFLFRTVFLLLALWRSTAYADRLLVERYSENLTPSDFQPSQPVNLNAAQPNTNHASSSYNYPVYGESDKTFVTSRHNFGHDSIAYSRPYQEEDEQEGLKLTDVIHSVGALLHLMETFPQLGQKTTSLLGKNHHHQPNFHNHDAPSTNFHNHHQGDTYSPSTNVHTTTQISSTNYGEDNPWTTLSQLDRHQCTYADSVTFPCVGPDLRPSFYKPTSVHHLRPGDIQVVAALGDGLVAAQGALSGGLSSISTQYRGLSFATGGDSDWRTILTIPNILREFNPRLIGTSSKSGGVKSGYAGFNVAEIHAVSSDLESQAENLIAKIKRNSATHLRDDWKLVTVLIGQNDLCKLSCYRNGSLAQVGGDPGNFKSQSPKEYAENVKKGLDKLYQELPRTLVSLVLPPDPTLAMEAFHRPLLCHLSTKVICPCVDGPFSIGRREMVQLLDEYRQALIDLVNSSAYDKFEDFTVAIQPGLRDLKLPKSFATFFGIHKAFLPDLSYLASDCFHPSQKLQAFMAKNIWNNMLEPEEAKSTWTKGAKLRCPTRSEPYLATYKNSQGTNEDDDKSEDDYGSNNKPFERKRLRKRRKKNMRQRRSYSATSCNVL